jgi:hypothetical protein
MHISISSRTSTRDVSGNFISPGSADQHAPLAFWPQYNLKDKPVLQWKKDNITTIPDGEFAPWCSSEAVPYFPWTPSDFNLAKTDFLNSAKVLGEFEKR